LTEGEAYLREKFILLSEKMLHEEYDHKGAVVKKTLIVSPKGLGTKTV
jgi:hypothetical protein